MVSGDYHEGVLGIVASNIVEQYQRPVLIMNNKEGILKGSARSVFDFNIYTAINKIGDKFIAYGGHTLAAGFSFDEQNFKEIEEALCDEFDEYKNNNELKSTKNIDIVSSLEEVSYQFLNSLEVLKPFGMDFEKPNILLENAKVIEKVYFGADKQYLRLTIADEVGNLECISFKDNMIFKDVNVNDTIDLLCTLDKNYFNGRTKLQAHIIDMQIKEFLFEDLRYTNFDETTISIDSLKLSKDIDNKQSNYYCYKDLDNIDTEYSNIYLLDIPHSLEDINKILELKPKKIYLICNDKQIMSEVYKIDKSRLVKLFNIVLNAPNKRVNITQQLDYLLSLLKTNINSLKIMIQIFQELNLVKVENNIIILNPNYETVDLRKSSMYVKMENIFEVEKLLLKDSIININKKFEK